MIRGRAGAGTPFGKQGGRTRQSSEPSQSRFTASAAGPENAPT